MHLHFFIVNLHIVADWSGHQIKNHFNFNHCTPLKLHFKGISGHLF